MASNTCSQCGARFNVKGAVGSLDQHMASFHPGAASKAQLEKAEEQGTPSAAPTPGTAAPSTDKPLSKMTTVQLTEVATAENIDISAATTNKERVLAIEAARSA